MTEVVKQRHGCLTAWLIVAIIANSVLAIVYLFGSAALQGSAPGIPGWGFPILAILCLANLAYAIALLRWKKWGFWGYCAISIVALLVNLGLGLTVGSSIAGLVGMFLLFGVLHIGGENKGWPQLD